MLIKKYNVHYVMMLQNIGIFVVYIYIYKNSNFDWTCGQPWYQRVDKICKPDFGAAKYHDDFNLLEQN